MNKEKLIQEKLLKPFEIGDLVTYTENYTKSEMVKVKGKKDLQRVETDHIFKTSGVIKEILEDLLILHKDDSQTIPYNLNIKQDYTKKEITVDKTKCLQNTILCGYNPDWKKEIRIQEYRQELSALLTKIYGFKSHDFGRELNWNPVFETQTEPVYYQRDFCWTIQQNQLLIESIFNQIPIGRFIFRKRSWEYFEKYKDDPIRQGSHYEIVDGKQRLNAIKQFIENKYPTQDGYYYKDFSINAVRRFERYSNLVVAELYENTTDEEVKEIFLLTNFSGVQMSIEHLEFVKNIKL